MRVFLISFSKFLFLKWNVTSPYNFSISDFTNKITIKVEQMLNKSLLGSNGYQTTTLFTSHEIQFLSNLHNLHNDADDGGWWNIVDKLLGWTLWNVYQMYPNSLYNLKTIDDFDILNKTTHHTFKVEDPYLNISWKILLRQ